VYHISRLLDIYLYPWYSECTKERRLAKVDVLRNPGVKRITNMITPNSETARILARSLEKLAGHEGLTVLEVAARCVITNHVPVFPAFSREVVSAYARLESELTRGIPQAREEVNA
jgi:hypothetical protein